MVLCCVKLFFLLQLGLLINFFPISEHKFKLILNCDKKKVCLSTITFDLENFIFVCVHFHVFHEIRCRYSWCPDDGSYCLWWFPDFSSGATMKYGPEWKYFPNYWMNERNLRQIFKVLWGKLLMTLGIFWLFLSRQYEFDTGGFFFIEIFQP